MEQLVGYYKRVGIIIKIITSYFSLRIMQWGITAGLLFGCILILIHYRSVSHTLSTVRQLKHEYETYIVNMHDALQHYTKTRDRLEMLEAFLEHAGMLGECPVGHGMHEHNWFEAGSRLFSSDDDVDEQSDSAILVNRDAEYLQQMTFDFIHQQGLVAALQEMLHEEHNGVTTQHKKKRTGIRSASRSRAQHTALHIPAKNSVKKVTDIRLRWPLDQSSFWISSLFGQRKKPNGTWGFHHGIDLAALRGTPVYAPAGGVVTTARYTIGYGNTIVIAHDHKYSTRYAHLSSMTVQVGQKIRTGQLIGRVGDTGSVRKMGKDASHLHFEVSAFGKRINPLSALES